MKSTTTHLILLYMLSVICGWTIAIDDPVSSHDGAFSDPREQSFGGKRAYEYRSEYKRLPLFQFGLGKRMAPSYEEKRSRLLSFGLGKRKPNYVFGLGKRSGYDEDGYADEMYDDLVSETFAQDKRTQNGFTFALGQRGDGETNVDNWLHKKRLRMKYAKADFPFGLGKRYYKEDEDYDGLFA